MKKIELLAPAGNIEAFRAAVENGADAIYLGGSMFSARQYADNFQIPELTDAVNYAHTRNVKVYVTVNTLVLNREMKELVNFLYEVAQTNVDAFIVQDLGVAGLIRRLLPEIELHASTQMAVHNSSGVNFLEKNGFYQSSFSPRSIFGKYKRNSEKFFLRVRNLCSRSFMYSIFRAMFAK